MNFGNVCARYARARVLSPVHRRWYAAAASTHNLRRIQSSPSNRPSFLYQNDDNNKYAFRCLTSVKDGENDEDDEEWIPPDHSPLASNETASFSEHPPSFKKLDSLPLDTLEEDEIEVIDLEATLSNDHNRQYLQNQAKASDMSPSEFDIDVETSESDWKEILKELKDSGETEMLDRLVHEYNLQSHLAALENDTHVGKNDLSSVSVSVSETENLDEDNDEWDKEFEESLQGLSQDEIIDELIENSPELSELEMEILSQEMERSEEGGTGGLDYESLEELDWNDNKYVRDFRAMVLEDYYEKKQTREKKMEGEKEQVATISEGGVVHSPATTKAYTKSNYTSYPPDWKDYDSKSAFQRDFSEDDDSWVPPSEGFVPSQSYVAQESHNEGDVQNPPKDTDTSTNDLDNTIDWLQARRTRLGDGSRDERSKQRPTHMLTPEDAETFRHQNSQIPIIPYTLLTPSEISNSLAAQGGTDVHTIDTSEFDPMHGAGTGCDFIMLVTARNSSHTRVLADSIVRNLKARKLSERGVMGAMEGAEGGQDIFSNKRSRNRAARHGGVSASRRVDDDWMAVDCDNIHVHILEESTRKCLNIEGLWDLSNPDSEGSKLRRVHSDDEDSVDDYVAQNPIPDEYAAKIFNQGGGGGGGRIGGWITG
ncbi:hypothetical protein ACHAXR_007221, partial [Thalassiosira sp. AJA248-18]